MRRLGPLLLATLLGHAPRPAVACTTFCLAEGGRPLIGKSYDWDLEQALVVVNPKGLEKRALLLDLAEGNVAAAARRAGLDRPYLHRLLKKHGLRGRPSD